MTAVWKKLYDFEEGEKNYLLEESWTQGLKFADDTNSRGAVDEINSRKALQRNLRYMKFKKRCILHLGWGNLGCMDRLGNEMLESGAVERDLVVLVDGKLKTSLHEASGEEKSCPGSQNSQPCPGGASGKASPAS
ncbi:hypothetical protein BTVI_12069 [Pitangus sulphuratus]|nr:hypothetical protein BTVI_12069 [Pitangus sulphuratus]